MLDGAAKMFLFQSVSVEGLNFFAADSIKGGKLLLKNRISIYWKLTVI